MEQTASRKILIVDDDRLICWALERELALKRLDRRSAGTAKACMEEVGRQQYDVVFLEQHLPDANGTALIPAIRQASPASRVVIITRDGRREDQEAAISAGAVQFLEKPFDLSLVGGIVNGLFGEYMEHRRAPRYYCNLRLWIRLSESPSSAAEEVCGTAEEIGPRGMRIATLIPLEPGQIVWPRPIDPGRPFSSLLPTGGAEVEWLRAVPPGYMAGLRYLTPARTSGPGIAANRS